MNPSRVRLCRFVYIWLVVYCPIPISMILEVYDEIPVVPDVAALTMERAYECVYVFMFYYCRTYYHTKLFACLLLQFLITFYYCYP